MAPPPFSADGDDWLAPDFDAAKLTSGQLRSLLARHDVAVPQAETKKTALLELFEKKLAKRRADLIAEKAKPRKKAKAPRALTPPGLRQPKDKGKRAATEEPPAMEVEPPRPVTGTKRKKAAEPEDAVIEELASPKRARKAPKAEDDREKETHFSDENPFQSPETKKAAAVKKTPGKRGRPSKVPAPEREPEPESEPVEEEVDPAYSQPTRGRGRKQKGSSSAPAAALRDVEMEEAPVPEPEEPIREPEPEPEPQRRQPSFSPEPARPRARPAQHKSITKLRPARHAPVAPSTPIAASGSTVPTASTFEPALQFFTPPPVPPQFANVGEWTPDVTTPDPAKFRYVVPNALPTFPKSPLAAPSASTAETPVQPFVFKSPEPAKENPQPFVFKSPEPPKDIPQPFVFKPLEPPKEKPAEPQQAAPTAETAGRRSRSASPAKPAEPARLASPEKVAVSSSPMKEPEEFAVPVVPVKLDIAPEVRRPVRDAAGFLPPAAPGLLPRQGFSVFSSQQASTSASNPTLREFKQQQEAIPVIRDRLGQLGPGSVGKAPVKPIVTEINIGRAAPPPVSAIPPISAVPPSSVGTRSKKPLSVGPEKVVRPKPVVAPSPYRGFYIALAVLLALVSTFLVADWYLHSFKGFEPNVAFTTSAPSATIPNAEVLETASQPSATLPGEGSEPTEAVSEDVSEQDMPMAEPVAKHGASVPEATPGPRAEISEWSKYNPLAALLPSTIPCPPNAICESDKIVQCADKHMMEHSVLRNVAPWLPFPFDQPRCVLDVQKIAMERKVARAVQWMGENTERIAREYRGMVECGEIKVAKGASAGIPVEMAWNAIKNETQALEGKLYRVGSVDIPMEQVTLAWKQFVAGLREQRGSDNETEVPFPRLGVEGNVITTSSAPIISWRCRAKRFGFMLLPFVGGALVLVGLFSTGHSKFRRGQAEADLVARLHGFVMAELHQTRDPVSINQLRDHFLTHVSPPRALLRGAGTAFPQDEGGRFYVGTTQDVRRIWLEVRKLVEHNANVRVIDADVAGEFHECWQWIGPVPRSPMGSPPQLQAAPLQPSYEEMEQRPEAPTPTRHVPQIGVDRPFI